MTSINSNKINFISESLISNNENKNNSPKNKTELFSIKKNFSNSKVNLNHQINSCIYDYSNEFLNNTFSNIQPQMKNVLDISDNKNDTENSASSNHNFVKNNKALDNNDLLVNDNLSSLNKNKLKFSDSNLPTEEDLIFQKNAKIMLRSKLYLKNLFI